MLKKARIAVLVSGGGTNLQALIDAEKKGKIKHGEIAVVISNNPKAYALVRAKDNGIKAECVDKKQCKSHSEFEEALCRIIDLNRIDMIILAGFMSILSEGFTSKYAHRIINIHPSLIPSFCGKGYYGLNVHEAALRYGVKVTGATVHYVNEVPDGGEIIMQRAVKVLKNDSPKSLQQRVMEQAEWVILPKAAEQVAKRILKEKRYERV